MTFNLQKNILAKLSEDVKKDIINNYLTKDISDLINDDEYINTIESFFENNLNVSQTSKKTFMHRNTLNYRLDKIYNTTGINIKNFNEALLMQVLIDIVKEKKN